MIRTAFACAALLMLAGCADLARVCEDVEPFRPLIRGAIDIATEGATVLPFMVTSQISCADLEAIERRIYEAPSP